MIFPLALLVGSLIALRLVAKESNPILKVGSTRIVSQTQAPPSQASLQIPPCLQRLIWAIQSGMQPTREIIDNALLEAYDMGNHPLIQKIASQFPVEESKPSERNEQSESIGTVIGKNSPFEGVSNDSWSKFVDRLSTSDPNYQSDKHVGQFYHSKSRLNQLGIDDVSTPEKQYEALVSDLMDSRARASDLIHDHICRPIKIGNDEYPITLSGLLGLLKSAGPSKAKSWLENESDRINYPKTTEMFIATNGVF